MSVTFDYDGGIWHGYIAKSIVSRGSIKGGVSKNISGVLYLSGLPLKYVRISISHGVALSGFIVKGIASMLIGGVDLFGSAIKKVVVELFGGVVMTGEKLITWVIALVGEMQFSGAIAKSINKYLYRSLDLLKGLNLRQIGSYTGKKIRFRYTANNVTMEKEFTYLSIRGFDDPDEILFFPPLRYDFLDGTSKTAFKGFRRVITIDLGVVDSILYRKFILSFMTRNDRSVTYYNPNIGAEEIFVVLDGSEHQTDWLENSSLFRRINIRLVEKVLRSEWSSYTPPSTVDIMYIKNKVKIEGTQASPEWFVTNFDKLETSESGNPYPNISLLSYAVTVITPPYQDAKINQVGEVQQNGSNIEFQLAVSDAGNPSADGFCYADIIIGLEARA